MELIDKHAAYTALKHEEETHGLSFSAEAFGKAARIIDKMPTVPDVNRAEILRLCNEIEDAVTDIDRYETNQAIYTDCEYIMKRLKAIGKELTGDAGSKID